MRGFALVVLVLTAMAGPIRGAEDVGEIVKRFVATDAKNRELAGQYAFREEAVHFGYDKAGVKKKERSETYDVIFVEGEEYKKLVARNDAPLNAKEAAKEEKRLQQTAEERRRNHNGLLHKTVHTGGNSDLLTMFENRLVGEEDVQGRKAWVIECTPKKDYTPANDDEKEALSFTRKIWIDEAELVELRQVNTEVGVHQVFMPGFTIDTVFEKVSGEAWMPVSIVLDGRIQMMKVVKARVRTEQGYSNFRKFDVKSTISVGG